MSFGGHFPGLNDDPFFSSRPRSLLGEDPFFSRHRNFPTFPMLGFPSLLQDQGRFDTPNRSHHHRRNDDEVALMDPFSMFRSMDQMMSGMMRPPQMQAPVVGGQGHFHSSSSVMHYSSVGGAAPKVYSASSSVTQGPGGVKEMRKSECDSETGMKKMMIGHHIGERGHVIERRQNTKKKESEQHQEFINLDEDESETFDKEWQDSTRRLHHQWSRGIRGGDHDRFADSRGLERPGGLLPPLSEKDARAAQRNDRRSRSPERENLHHRSSKRRHDSDGNAARRREYVKEERKVHF